MQMHYASEVHSVSVYLPSQHGYPTGWQRGVSYHARITPIFWKLSRITGKYNKIFNCINKYPIIIWSEEIRGQGTTKKGKKLVS